MERSFESQGSEFYDKFAEDGVEDFVEQRFFNNPAEVARVEHLIDKIPEDVTSLLDVGAGYGVFLHELLKRRDLVCEGVEISKLIISWGLERGIKIRLASAHELPYEDQQFDMISCTEVLEHLQWGIYEKSLEELSRVAKKWILVSVPYDERRNFATCPYCKATTNPQYHHRSFHPSQLEGLIPGFELRAVDHVGTLSKLTLLKPYLPTAWHSSLVCASCGYRPTKTGLSPGRKNKGLEAVKAVVHKIPFPKVPRWLTGLYSRTAQ